MADPRTLPPEADPTNQPGITESFEQRADRRNPRTRRDLRETGDDTVETDIDPAVSDSYDLDHSYAGRSETQVGMQREANASRSLDQREWEQGPTATADQSQNDSTNVAPLFSEFEIDEFRTNWNKVQADFVDSPRHSVQQADELVATVIQRITTGFAEERTSLEHQWDSGANVSTEDLRVALQRYRSFFGRLLSAA